MGIQTFEYCSLSYLNLWSQNDKFCTEALSGNDRSLKFDALKRTANVYRVARNLQTQYDISRGLERFEPVLNILESAAIESFEKDPISEIRKIEKLVSESYGNKGVLSLTTKFLWQKIKKPILIYDSHAQKALEIKSGDLEGFYEKWYLGFKSFEPEITDACENLTNVFPYMKTSKIKISEEEVENISSQQWFKERVFDTYLWNKG